MSYLKKRFEKLWRTSDAVGDCVTVFHMIEKLHCTPKRYYHTFEGHIAFCMRELERVDHFLENSCAVEWAIFLHDIVMDTRRYDNEEESARYAYQILQCVGLSESFSQKVVRLIISSRHVTVPRDFEEQVFCDIDLLILGQPRNIFDQYEADVRREYAWVDEEVFWHKRCEFLKRFLENRDSVFSTEHYRNLYEKRAQENIARTIVRHTNH